MKLTVHHLRSIIRSVIQESLEEKKKRDRDGDGDKDFADVMMARMHAGGLSDEEAFEKSRKFDDLDEADGEPRKFARNVMLPSSDPNKTGSKPAEKSSSAQPEPSGPYKKPSESKHKAVNLGLDSVMSDPRLSDKAREELRKLFNL